MMKLVALCLSLLALTACDLEKMHWEDRPDDPTIIGSANATADAGVVGIVCPTPDPDYCRSGYFKAISRDGKKLFCELLASCPSTPNPCVQGAPVGDPDEIMLCYGVVP
jgi:hypothetical protein